MSFHTIELIWNAILAFGKFLIANPFGILIIIVLICGLILLLKKIFRRR